MNALQKAQYDILVELDRILTKHGIPYSLGYGTALGAVRHRGFIPWDDDLDILMMRKDYEKLRKIWPPEAPAELFWQDREKEHEYPNAFAKIRNTNTTYVETGCGGLGITGGVFVDIFYYDYLSKNPFERLWQLFCCELAWMLSRKYMRLDKYNRLRAAICRTLCMFFTAKTRLKALRFLERQTGRCNAKNAELACLCTGLPHARYVFPRDMLKNTGRVRFEEGEFLLMKDSDIFLKERYGDYMTLPPEDQRQPAHPYEKFDLTKPDK